MQVTINPEPELLEAAQKKAKFQKTSLDNAMSQLLRLGLAAETEPRTKDTYTLSLPGGVIIPDDVKAILESDDE